MRITYTTWMLVMYLAWGLSIASTPTRSLPNNVNFRDGERLIEAIMHHNITAITTLLHQNSAIAHYVDSFGDSALMRAVTQCLPSVIQQLLDAGANANYRSKTGYTALHRAITHAHRKPEITKMLLTYGANPDGENHPLETPLVFAIRKKHISLAALLLENKASPHRTNLQEETPLFTAVSNPEAVALLLAYGADPNHINSKGESPLQKAVKMAKTKSVLLLLKAGADPNYDISQRCFSPVIQASIQHSSALIRILFSYGTRIPTKEQWEKTEKHLFSSRITYIKKHIATEEHIAKKRCESIYRVCQDVWHMPSDLARLIQQVSVDGTPERYDRLS